MKKTISSIFALFLYTLAFAQVSLDNTIATNFVADGKILVLNVPPQFDGSSLVVAWVNSQNQQGAIETIAKAGKHLVELRNNPLWKGDIKAVAISLPTITGIVEQASFGEEFQLFLGPDLQTPRSINFVQGYSLFSVRYSYLLFGLLLLFIPLFYFIGKTSLSKAFLFAFLAAWILFDLRNTANHFAIQKETKANNFTIAPFTQLPILVDKANQIIGEKTWALEPLPGVYHSFTQYHLAEKPYVRFRKRPRKESKKGVQYVVTNKPKNRKVVATHQGISVVSVNKKQN